MTYAPMTEQQRSNVQGIIDNLTRVGEAIGGWTEKMECRRTGLSYYVTFQNKVDITMTMEFVTQLAQCPAMLADACRKLLAADNMLSETSTTVYGCEEPGHPVDHTHFHYWRAIPDA